MTPVILFSFHLWNVLPGHYRYLSLSYLRIYQTTRTKTCLLLEKSFNRRNPLFILQWDNFLYRQRETLYKIARALNVPTSELIEDAVRSVKADSRIAPAGKGSPASRSATRVAKARPPPAELPTTMICRESLPVFSNQRYTASASSRAAGKGCSGASR